MASLTDLQNDYTALQSSVNAFAVRVSALENAGSDANSHFESLLSHPALILHRSMREPAHALETRGGLKTSNPNAYYVSTIDAMKQVIPPFLNEMKSGIQYAWNQPTWNVGDRLVIQVEMLISKALHDLVPLSGLNGRSAGGYKHLNICVGDNANIRFETKASFTAFADQSEIAFRCYSDTLEGRMGGGARWASWASNPTLNAPISSGGGSDWDEHPGPDSIQTYQNNTPHPQCFRATNDRWVCLTYQLDRVAEGTRMKTWIADELSTQSALLMASPSNSAIGFLMANTLPPRTFYFEMDSSQETTYATNMNETALGERYCAFRNFLVFRGSSIRGEDILHIPKR